MRILVVADVHANLAAFEAVIEAAQAGGAIDQVWSLGDIVGYGPQPSECIELLRSYPHVAISGNHDLAAVEAIGLQDFNPIAASAVAWTRDVLSRAERAWLRDLPPTTIEGDFTLTHGSLRDPVWDYLLSVSLAETHLRLQTTPYSFVGHSHVPIAFFETDTWARSLVPADGTVLDLGEQRLIANPGGLGQPRDGDPRACYALLDTEARRLQFCRVAYDIERTQARMREVRLPPYLVERLARGR